jgi:hypothetical protein
MDPMAAAASVTFSGRGSRLLAATDSWPDSAAVLLCAGGNGSALMTSSQAVGKIAAVGRGNHPTAWP